MIEWDINTKNINFLENINSTKVKCLQPSDPKFFNQCQISWGIALKLDRLMKIILYYIFCIKLTSFLLDNDNTRKRVSAFTPRNNFNKHTHKIYSHIWNTSALLNKLYKMGHMTTQHLEKLWNLLNNYINTYSIK